MLMQIKWICQMKYTDVLKCHNWSNALVAPVPFKYLSF